MRRIDLALFTVLFFVSVSFAQDKCPLIVEQALFSLDTACADTGRNEACYGNFNLNADLFTDYDIQFENVGDIIELQAINTLSLSPMNVDTGEWGVALLNLQADIPDTLPGQNVTFILFGDVSIQNAASEDQNPMQAFFLRTGIGDSACEEAPDSGVLVQTPEGVESVVFNVNGMDMAVGSTVLLQVGQNDDMVITTLEGTVGLQVDAGWAPIIAGTQVRIPLDGTLLPTNLPALPDSYDLDVLSTLPIDLLPREIIIETGLDPQTLESLRKLLQDGQMPCDAFGLPDCDFSSLFNRPLLDSQFWGTLLNDEIRQDLEDLQNELDGLQGILDTTLRDIERDLGDAVDDINQAACDVGQVFSVIGIRTENEDCEDESEQAED